MNATTHIAGDAPGSAPPVPDLATSVREAQISLFLARLGAAVLVALVAVTVGRLTLLDPWQEPPAGEPAQAAPAPAPLESMASGEAPAALPGPEAAATGDAMSAGPVEGTADGTAEGLGDAGRWGAAGGLAPPIFGVVPMRPQEGGRRPLPPVLPRPPAMGRPLAEPGLGARGRDG